MERFAEDAGLLAKVRDYLAKNAVIVSKVIEGKETEGAKFQDYFDHQELLKKQGRYYHLYLLQFAENN